MCRLSRNLGVSTSLNPKGLSRPVMGLLYLCLTVPICYRKYKLRLQDFWMWPCWMSGCQCFEGTTVLEMLEPLAQWYSVTSQKTWMLIDTAVKTSNLKSVSCSAIGLITNFSHIWQSNVFCHNNWILCCVELFSNHDIHTWHTALVYNFPSVYLQHFIHNTACFMHFLHICSRATWIWGNIPVSGPWKFSPDEFVLPSTSFLFV
jgi:hypothetical protein